MSQITIGSRVSLHYIGTLENGRIFDNTPDDEPLIFTVGAGEVFPALEKAIAGMRTGEVRNVTIPATDAYGPRVAENVIRVQKSDFPATKEIRVGQKISVEFGRRGSRVMIITGLTDEMVTLDGNHPLAGLDLTFALRVDAVD